MAWHERDHAVFVGYAPIKLPRYAVAVVVEHGGSGAKTAAPVARDILLELQKLDPTNELDTSLENKEAHILPEVLSTRL